MAKITSVTFDRRGNATRWVAEFNGRLLRVGQQGKELVVVCCNPETGAPVLDKKTGEAMRLHGEELTSFLNLFKYHNNRKATETVVPVVQRLCDVGVHHGDN